MLDRFPRHERRRVTDLSGVWDFAFLGDVDPDRIDPSQIEFDDVMAVPGNFDASPRYAGKRGLAAYRCYAGVQAAGHYRLVLDGVHHWSRTYVNGHCVGEHRNGFTRFSYTVEDPRGPLTQIVVLVDNRFDTEKISALHQEYYDWYHYGGIARGAQWHCLGRHWINALRVAVEDLEARKVSIFVDYSAFDLPCEHELVISWGRKELLRQTLQLDNKYGKIRRSVQLEGAALWSPESPNLQHLHVSLGNDDMRERIGLRSVEVRDRQILINGQPKNLLGFCRHEAHPQFGHGLPDHLIVSDLQQLLDAGCNFVRGSHYPQDQRFLDLCDEMGLCVWNESTGWGNNPEHLTDKRFQEEQVENVNEMVASAVNHPSVILWGVLNEAYSDSEESREIFELLLGKLRQLDPTRPVTYATCRPKGDVNLDLADVISVNCYPGWYVGEVRDIPDYLDDLVDFFNKEGLAEKPLIISEIGAGAFYGWRDQHETRWSEAYQRKHLETVVSHMFERSDAFAGLSIWQFCDMRTSHHVRMALGRPRAFNNKGVVDEYRRPKQAYHTVRELYRRIGRLD
jgi:beta-glucuronidase